MRVNLVIVPPGGGEADYSMDFDLPAVPRPGDYIGVSRPDSGGVESFIVRRTWWLMNFPLAENSTSSAPAIGKVEKLCVECEFARGIHDSPSHKKACDTFEHRGKPIKEFDSTAY